MVLTRVMMTAPMLVWVIVSISATTLLFHPAAGDIYPSISEQEVGAQSMGPVIDASLPLGNSTETSPLPVSPTPSESSSQPSSPDGGISPAPITPDPTSRYQLPQVDLEVVRWAISLLDRKTIPQVWGCLNKAQRSLFSWHWMSETMCGLEEPKLPLHVSDVDALEEFLDMTVLILPPKVAKNTGAGSEGNEVEISVESCANSDNWDKASGPGGVIFDAIDDGATVGDENPKVKQMRPRWEEAREMVLSTIRKHDHDIRHFEDKGTYAIRRAMTTKLAYVWYATAQYWLAKRLEMLEEKADEAAAQVTPGSKSAAVAAGDGARAKLKEAEDARVETLRSYAHINQTLICLYKIDKRLEEIRETAAAEGGPNSTAAIDGEYVELPWYLHD